MSNLPSEISVDRLKRIAQSGSPTAIANGLLNAIKFIDKQQKQVTSMGDNGFSENVLAIDQSITNLNREVTRLRAINAELVSHLKVIVMTYEDTYDGDQHDDGTWSAAASIPISTMEAASRLLKKL